MYLRPSFIHPPFVHRIPPEVLLHIFCYVIYGQLADITSLLLTCRLFNTILLNHPCFWTTISPNWSPHRIHLHLSRSRSLPLSIVEGVLAETQVLPWDIQQRLELSTASLSVSTLKSIAGHLWSDAMSLTTLIVNPLRAFLIHTWPRPYQLCAMRLMNVAMHSQPPDFPMLEELWLCFVSFDGHIRSILVPWLHRMPCLLRLHLGGPDLAILLDRVSFHGSYNLHNLVLSMPPQDALAWLLATPLPSQNLHVVVLGDLADGEPIHLDRINSRLHAVRERHGFQAVRHAWIMGTAPSVLDISEVCNRPVTFSLQHSTIYSKHVDVTILQEVVRLSFLATLIPHLYSPQCVWERLRSYANLQYVTLHTHPGYDQHQQTSFVALLHVLRMYQGQPLASVVLTVPSVDLQLALVDHRRTLVRVQVAKRVTIERP
jgi:hypothetical protein